MYNKDIFDLYLEIWEDSESPRMYHRWSLAAGIGALLGRDFYYRDGTGTIYPTQYVTLIGNAGSRKSTAISLVKKHILEPVGYKYFSSGKTTQQKLYEDLANGFADTIGDINALLDISDDAPCEAFIVAGELEAYFGRNNTELISQLTDFWDNLDNFIYRTKGAGSLHIHKPTISFIGGATPTTFSNTFGEDIIGAGFLSRMILVFGGGRRKKIPRPPAPNKDALNYIVGILKEMKKVVKGEASFNKEAEEIYDEIYYKHNFIADSRFDSYNTRRMTHLTKLCLIFAASNLRTSIEPEDLIRANTMLSYTESFMPRALGEFGSAKKGGVAEAVMQALYSANKPLSMADIFKRVNTSFDQTKDLSEVLQKLKLAEKIENFGTGFLAVNTYFDLNQPHVDFNLLKEYKEENYVD